jgi:dienelactone hydrolase
LSRAELESRGGRTFTRTSFRNRLIRHDVYVGGSGPPVILIHELGGLGTSALDVADRLCEAGFRVLLPSLVGRAGSPGSLLGTMGNGAWLCISWEVHVLLTGRTSPIATWLRALARREKGSYPGVGVVGMCFSGGFALAAAVDDTVIAAVASQPALPWKSLPGTDADLGLSSSDLACVRRRFVAGEFGVVAARYSGDTKSPKARIERYKTEFGTDVVYEPTGTEHSVLARAARPPGSQGEENGHDPLAVPSLNATIALLTQRLKS